MQPVRVAIRVCSFRIEQWALTMPKKLQRKMESS